MFSKILVPVDGSAASNHGLTEAIKMATTLGSRLYLVHIANEFIFDYTYSTAEYATIAIDSIREMGKTILAEGVAEAKKYGVQAQAELLETIGGRTADMIVRHAKTIGADIIVMGTHGRRGFRRLALGSDAEQVLRLAGIPVLMVRGETPAPETSNAALGGKPATTAPAENLGLR
jgi:nucleotide-binding universal stress UspA family protein